MAKRFVVNQTNNVTGYVGEVTNRYIDNFGPWTDKSRAYEYLVKCVNDCVKYMMRKGYDYQIKTYNNEHVKIIDSNNKWNYFELVLLDLSY
jgi:hypothetical protein